MVQRLERQRAMVVLVSGHLVDAVLVPSHDVGG